MAYFSCATLKVFQHSWEQEKLFLHGINEIIKHSGKSNLCFLPKPNSRREKDNQTSAWIGDSLCHHLPKRSIWAGGGGVIFPKLNGMNDFLFPGTINLTGKLLYFAKQSSDSVTVCRGWGPFSQVICVCFYIIPQGRKSCPHCFIIMFFNLHFGSDTLHGTLLFLISIDFLSWHVWSLTVLIITYLQMIFKFTPHFQPFQMMSPFALPRIWLTSCLGWATIFSDWIWMRRRLCSLVVNKRWMHWS